MQASRRENQTELWRGLRNLMLVVVIFCALAYLSQTAFAQNTFVITDGDQVKTYLTYSSDPAAVLDEAGVRLDEDDTYTTEVGDGIYEITVQRTASVTIDYCGELLEVESAGETVGELLARLSIPVDGDTRLSVPADTQVADGMSLKVSRTVRVNETYAAPIAYETIYCEDPSLPAGTEVVLTEGSDGQMACTAVVVYEAGVEVARVVTDQKVIQQPVNQVVAIGTGAQQSVEAQGGLIIGDGIIILEDGQVLTYTGTMQVEATAYTHTDAGCDFWTSTNTHVRIGTVAVDPRLIPYGTRMFIVANDGTVIYGIATAEDCGGDIKNHRIDLYYPTYEECIQFGRRDCTIYFLG